MPFSFIMDYLIPLEVTVKSMFGMFAIYAGEKILMMLRQRNEHPERNGIWLAIDKEFTESLKTEFPSFAVIYGLPHKSEISEWLMLDSDAEDFESTAIKLCELIAKGDQRIGHIPRSRRSR